jgi:hypothetical protein
MPFELEALLAQASERAGGLKDFGADDFRSPLEVLLRELEERAKLSELGRSILQYRIVELLTNRLIVEDCCRRYPEILAEEIRHPVVIVGLPRTGTTLLQRILACDPRRHHLKYWESKYPAPLPGTGIDDIEARIKAGRDDVRLFLQSQPRLAAIHPLEAEAPDEEVMLLEHSFCSAFDAYANVPGYTAWLWQADKSASYEYLKRMLRFIQWQQKRRGIRADGWILKTPHHLRQISTLFRVFPDVRVIQTHRDPLETIPSIASFNETLWKIYSDEVNPREVGRQWSAIFARGMRETMEFRAGLSEGHFLDISFRDTLARPMETVRAIFDYLDTPFPEGLRVRMETWLEQNSRDRRPAHEYTLQRFGLAEEQLKRDFASYRERYILR